MADVTATPDASPSTVSLPLPETIEASGSPAPTTNPEAAPEINAASPPLSASIVAPPGQTAAAEAIAPMRWQPLKRSGIAGIVDEMRDALAGHPTKIYTDANGNKYVGEVDESGARKWTRIAAELAAGAARGYAAGQGPGGPGRAAVAGLETGLQQGERQRQQTKEQQAEVRQDTLDKFNSRVNELKLAEATFRLKRSGIEAAQSDYKFNQEQMQHERDMKSIDLGLHGDHYAVADVIKQDPNFWKDWHEGKIVEVPEVSPDGKRLGLHLFLRTQSMTDQVAPVGSPIARFVPPQKPGDKGTMQWDKTAQTMSEQARQDATVKAHNDYNAWIEVDQGPQLKAAQIDDVKAQTKERQAATTKDYAEASKANEESRKLKIEREQLGVIDDNTSAQTLGQMLFDGRAAPSLVKNRKNYQQALAWADQISKQQTGQGYDAAMGEARYDAYKKGVTRYLSGDKADNIASFDKFLGHTLNASQAINAAQNTSVRLINTPFNELSRQLNGSSSNELHTMVNAINAARTEYLSFMSGNHALTDHDKKLGDTLLNDNAKPSDMQAALKEWERTAAIRLRGEDFEFLRLTQGSSHIPNLLSSQAADSFSHFGINPQSVYSAIPGREPTPGLGANVQTGNVPAAPAPAPPPTGTVTQFGVLAGGKTYYFNTQQEADRFRSGLPK